MKLQFRRPTWPIDLWYPPQACAWCGRIRRIRRPGCDPLRADRRAVFARIRPSPAALQPWSACSPSGASDVQDQENARRLPARSRTRRSSRRHVCRSVPNCARPRFRRIRSTRLQACNSAPCCGWHRRAGNGGGTTFGSCRESFPWRQTLSNESFESFAADGFRLVMCWHVMGLRRTLDEAGLGRSRLPVYQRLDVRRDTVGSANRALGRVREGSHVGSPSEQFHPTLPHCCGCRCDHRVGPAERQSMMGHH